LGNLVEIFGGGILTDSVLDRKKLAAIVFESREALRKLNDLIHPLIGEEILRRIEEERLDGSSVVVVDAALIFEAATEDRYDVVVVVNAPLEQRLARLQKSKGFNEKRALLIDSTQMDAHEKSERGDFIIENGGSLDELENASKTLYYKILGDYKAKNKGVDER
jgi:dephospho-CoA kinase